MIGDSDRSGRARLLAVLLLLGVFAAGALAGAATLRLVGASEAGAAVLPPQVFRDPPRQARPGGESEPRRSMSQILQRRLDLTEEQRAQVDGIFEVRRQRTEAVLRELEPRLQAQRDSTDLEIRAILTSEQQATFDRMVQQRREGPRGFRAGPGSGRQRDPGGR